jgi:hypothetical protein
MPVGISISGFIPREVINIDAVRLELLNALRAEGRAIRRDFQKTTRTWKRKPKFEMKVSLRRVADEGYVEVWTDNEIYSYVNYGTGMYIGRGRYRIAPKVRRRWAGGTPGGRGGRYRRAARAIAYPSRTTPKTTPGVLGSGPGSRGGPIRVRAWVWHPGIRGRHFDLAVAALVTKTDRFQTRVDGAITRGLAKARPGEIKIT